jgi:hypothetical protein
LLQRFDHPSLPYPPAPAGRARRGFSDFDGMMGGLGAASTEPDADQRQIGHAGPEQRHRQRDGQAFAGGLKDRSGHGENIGRFYPGSLGQYFLRDSGLVYDSGTPA